MIPTFQVLMRPVLECATAGEIKVSDVVDILANKLQLSDEDRFALLPSGKQTTFSNRVAWAKTFLAKAGLLEATRRGFFKITDRGLNALNDHSADINVSYLERYQEFLDFRKQKGELVSPAQPFSVNSSIETSTPDEKIRLVYGEITETLADELLERIRRCSPAFFERLIVALLLSMGYGGTSEEAGRAIGQSGDDGVDGVIDQDPLGVDQIYVQAKRYAEGNNVGPGAIRDFFGALSLKKAQKGIFVTTSCFTQAAVDTAKGLGSRIVLIDGQGLSKLMIRYNVGCRDEDVLHLKKIDEEFFETT